MSWGCSPRDKNLGTSRSPEGPEGPKRAIETGEVVVTATGPKGETLWRLRAQSSNLIQEQDENVRARGKTVRGEIYASGKPSSRFTANSGVAEKKDDRLVLEGDVVVRDLGEKLELRAERVEWNRPRQTLEAQGAVSVQTDSYRLGPFARLWATPDLRLRGTPQAFTKWRKKD